MSYSWMMIDRAFFIRWKQLQIADLTHLLRDLTNARRSMTQPIIYVSITPADHRVPTAEERQALNTFAAQAKHHCEVSYLVFEGDSMKHRIQRTALTSMLFLLQREHYSGTHIHKNVESVLQIIGPQMGRTQEELARQLRAREFMVD